MRGLRRRVSRKVLERCVSPLIVYSAGACTTARRLVRSVCSEYRMLILSTRKLRTSQRTVGVIRGGVRRSVSLVLTMKTNAVRSVDHCVTRGCGMPFVSIPATTDKSKFMAAMTTVALSKMGGAIPSMTPVYMCTSASVFSGTPRHLATTKVSSLVTGCVYLTS